MGKEVENKDLIVKLDEEMERRVPRPILIYVYAHAGIEGNEVVDKMAKLGASMPETEKDWTIREEEKQEKEAGGARRLDFGGFTIDIRAQPMASSDASR